MNKYLAGATAGLLATIPMTLAMQLLHRRLPREQQYPLPPYEITMKMAGKADLAKSMPPSQRTAATLTAHFGFGALAGALYPLAADRLHSPAWLNGAAYGVAVWGVSYLGWVPALRLLRPAAFHPKERVRLMILAHLVWGPATAELTRLLAKSPPVLPADRGG
jgi:uncharacterized membrane protein YagU involved in acid resistance